MSPEPNAAAKGRRTPAASRADMWAKGKKPASGMLETAVEDLRTNIMLADKDLNITYLNPVIFPRESGRG